MVTLKNNLIYGALSLSIIAPYYYINPHLKFIIKGVQLTCKGLGTDDIIWPKCVKNLPLTIRRKVCFLKYVNILNIPIKIIF